MRFYDKLTYKEIRIIKKITAFLVFLIVLIPVQSQIPQSNIVFSYLGLSLIESQVPLSLSETEFQLLETKLKTVLLEIARQENYSLTAPRNSAILTKLLSQGKNNDFLRELASQETSLTANGIIHFMIGSEASGGLTLTATLLSSPEGEVIMQVEIQAQNFDELSQTLNNPVYSLFGLASPTNNTDPKLAQNPQQRLSLGAYLNEPNLQLKDFAGKWQGDYGINMVEIFQDGNAKAWLNDKEYMLLKVSLNGSRIQVKQDEPNSPKIYLSVFPYSIASQAVTLARPMSWELVLSVEKDRLIGKKNTSYFYIERGNIVQVDNTYSRDAIWIRIP